MILQQNSSFSQKHRENLKVLSLPLGADVAACNIKTANEKLGAYFSSGNKKYIDLSEDHAFNPLGHNHPVNIRANWKMSEFSDYSSSTISEEKNLGNFITDPSQLFTDLSNQKDKITVQNFHGFSFVLSRGLENKKPHPVFHYLNYYSRLKTFEESGFYNEISSLIDQNLKVGVRKGMTIKLDNSVSSKSLAQEGIYINKEKTETLYFPIAILLDDLSHVIKSLNEVTCSN